MKYPPSFELVKWLAFVAMLIDHADLVLFGRSAQWTYEVGRFAYPTFVGLFAYGAALSRDPRRVAIRTGLAACVAQVAWWLIDPWYGVNVLGVMALLAAFAYVARPGGALLMGGIATLMLVAVPWLEGGFYGVPLGIGVILAVRFSSWWPALVGAVPYVVAPVGWGVLVAAIAIACATRVQVQLPRAGAALLWAYPAHLGLLAGCAALLR